MASQISGVRDILTILNLNSCFTSCGESTQSRDTQWNHETSAPPAVAPATATVSIGRQGTLGAGHNVRIIHSGAFPRQKMHLGKSG